MKRANIEAALGRQEIKLGDMIHAYDRYSGAIVVGTLVFLSGALEDVFGDIPGTERYAVEVKGQQFEVRDYLDIRS